MIADSTFVSHVTTALPANDDQSSPLVDITSVFESGINFFGRTWTGLYVNNNGNVTFGDDLYTYTPREIGGTSLLPIIAPFWADVDTRGAGSLVTYGVNTARDSFIVTWANVDYYNATRVDHQSKFNSFQLELNDMGHGDFDIVFRYGGLNWTTGDASGGTSGLGGNVARAGFASGDGENYFELEQSGRQADMLGLTSTLGSMNMPGAWQFEVRNGSARGVGSERADFLLGDDRANFMDGRSGDDRLEAGAGNDTVLGGTGNDTLVAGHGQGNDRYDGGTDNDTITFTSTTRGVRVNLTAGVASGSESNDDAISNVENVQGGSGRDTLIGDSGANAFKGFKGNDRLSGNAGNDSLDGGLGNDILTGGAGRDAFTFSSKPHRTKNVDKITDFKVKDDSFSFENSVFKGLGKATGALKSKAFWKGSQAHDQNDRLIYSSENGALYYDSDGTGAAAQIKIAQLPKNLKMTHKDFFII